MQSFLDQRCISFPEVKALQLQSGFYNFFESEKVFLFHGHSRDCFFGALQYLKSSFQSQFSRLLCGFQILHQGFLAPFRRAQLCSFSFFGKFDKKGQNLIDSGVLATEGFLG
ncbi:hypothetical protein BSK20_02885 [SR1 bacterium human oral taxon HOT-345]|nr:hypothetical protein BSK20_02885 [SR1 bacterium human oral taxon HOT-345]